jgi:hypothetical protein
MALLKGSTKHLGMKVVFEESLESIAAGRVPDSSGCKGHCSQRALLLAVAAAAAAQRFLVS